MANPSTLTIFQPPGTEENAALGNTILLHPSNILQCSTISGLPDATVSWSLEYTDLKEKKTLVQKLPPDDKRRLAHLLLIAAVFGLSGRNEFIGDTDDKEWVNAAEKYRVTNIWEFWQCFEIGFKNMKNGGFFFGRPGVVPSYELLISQNLTYGSILVYDNRVKILQMSNAILATAVSYFLTEMPLDVICIEVGSLNIKLWVNTQDEQTIRKYDTAFREVLAGLPIGLVKKSTKIDIDHINTTAVSWQYVDSIKKEEKWVVTTAPKK